MREGNIPVDWFSQQVAQADRTDGDIDTLSNRIAHVRTWTFVANRPDWLADPEHWQAVTRAVEDRLSDALHERLAERFVDRRTSVLMRRLRENTMLDTEIGKTGEVTVEGHVIGRLDGFMFAPDASGAGSDAKALNSAAQKALAGEIEARATKLSQASNDQLVLANDGALRWTGDLVGRLIAGDDVLRPRVRIIADEHLTGPAKELVQTRLDLWLKTHIEKLLAPLFSLAAADDVTGMARGIAFQLVESLGVLERQKVAEEVKGLEQPARATLRKYGVRFGAYHIYLPILLKPAPRSLATQLWALKHESPDAKGVTELLHLAASGRTSIPVEKDTPKQLYRTAGYRICGERAVRVDILERLADLIRPILSWRETSPGPKPEGVFDGRGFTVTGAMTSLTGASGEDFSSILRSLGYRMDRKPKPVEAKPAEPAPVTEAAPAAEAVPTETPQIETPQIETPHVESPPIEVVAVETVAAAEPAMIEVWRPAGRHENRPARPRRQPRPQKAATSVTAQTTEPVAVIPTETPVTPASSEIPERKDRQQRRERHERQKRVENQSQRFERKDGAQKRDRPPRRDKGNQVERAEREQYYAKPFGGSENRNKQADPNSPFAKLAALKQQLEQSTKES
jgi:ATP-dependent RNA helicase SUPV3L1/SUV3